MKIRKLQNCLSFTVTVLIGLAFIFSEGQTAIAANNDDRTINFVNMCPSTVRIGVNGSALLQKTSADRQPCSTSVACPTGSSCLLQGAATSGFCYFDFPAPTTGSAVLKPAGSASGTKASYTLTNPVWSNGVLTPNGVVDVPVKWSGNVYASTECDADGKNCKTGMCPLSKAGHSYIVPCKAGVGPQGPTTLAEFTLSNTGPDFYDVSQLNGMNVAVSMAPVSTAATNPNPGNKYWCGTPGSTTAQASGLQACSWSYKPTVGGVDQSKLLRAVTTGGSPCSAGCTGGDVCGYSYEVGTLDVAQVCGKQIGWWSADEFCTFTNGAFGSPINCSATVAGQGTNTNMFLCTGANAGSCYSAGIGANCCGCPDWKVGGHDLPLAHGFSCQNTNPSWTKIAMPWANVAKQACPTAYSFAYDDGTSTFTCNTQTKPTTNNPNKMDYTITFCPGGKTGY